jgi:hypothetical protein
MESPDVRKIRRFLIGAETVCERRDAPAKTPRSGVLRGVL